MQQNRPPAPAWAAQLRLLVFDLDGTLIDSAADIIDSANATLEWLGRRPLPANTIASFVGHGAPALMERVLARAKDTQPDERPESLTGIRADPEYDTALHEFLQIYDRLKLQRTRLYPGVEDALRRLQPGYTLAVLTNKPVRMSREILAGLGVERTFERIYGGDSFLTKKPDPEGLLSLMREMRALPGQTLMIGDSVVDIRAGINAGCHTCSVSYGLGADRLAELPAELRLDRFPELLDVLLAPRLD